MVIDPFVIFICLGSVAAVALIWIWVGIEMHHVVSHGHLVPEWIALICPSTVSVDADGSGQNDQVGEEARTAQAERYTAVDRCDETSAEPRPVYVQGLIASVEDER
jgi:hypothetical protein